VQSCAFTLCRAALAAVAHAPLDSDAMVACLSDSAWSTVDPLRSSMYRVAEKHGLPRTTVIRRNALYHALMPLAYNTGMRRMASEIVSNVRECGGRCLRFRLHARADETPMALCVVDSTSLMMDETLGKDDDGALLNQAMEEMFRDAAPTKLVNSFWSFDTLFELQGQCYLFSFTGCGNVLTVSFSSTRVEVMKALDLRFIFL
jgi:hypothetical protein